MEKYLPRVCSPLYPSLVYLQIVREQANGFYEEIEVQADSGIPFNG